MVLVLVACIETTQGVPAPNGVEVATEFETFYREFGGSRIFGEPITQAFQIMEDGPTIQYFQTMRLESAGEEAVVIYPLGEWAIEGLAELTPAITPQDSPSRYFEETDQTIQDEFWAFYETFHGERLLGPPISPQLNEGGVRVQYFRNGRLEWRPELPVEQRIQVSLLGQAHFDAEMSFIYRQTVLAQPVPSAGLSQVIVEATVQAPILYGGEQQTVYVTVRTPEGKPVQGIDVDVLVSHDDRETMIDLGQTDDVGKIVQVLVLEEIVPGEDVDLNIRVFDADGRVVGSTMLRFKTWW